MQLVEGIDRNMVKVALEEEGIPCMVYYPVSCHQQEAFLSQYPLQASLFPESERLAQQSLSLPIHTEMTEELVLYIIDKVLKVLSKF